MTEKVSETVRDSADYRCERCHKVTHMSKGALIQPCPHCGYDTFDIAIRASSAATAAWDRMSRVEAKGLDG